jgi:hypothetical protein
MDIINRCFPYGRLIIWKFLPIFQHPLVHILLYNKIIKELDRPKLVARALNQNRILRGIAQWQSI